MFLLEEGYSLASEKLSSNGLSGVPVPLCSPTAPPVNFTVPTLTPQVLWPRQHGDYTSTYVRH